MNSRAYEIETLHQEWICSERWKETKRSYTAEDVIRLRGSLKIEYTLAEYGARKLRRYLKTMDYVKALGALTGHQAVQQIQAGLKAIYVSGWQVAADANTGGQTYPDQSLYSADSVPALVRRINNALKREDEKQSLRCIADIDWFQPIIADAEAGFGGILNAFELMKAMMEAGAGGVHFEDQLASEKKCGHLGGKVVIPAREFVKKLTAARLAADVMGVPTVLIARTDAEAAKIIANNIDPLDIPFLSGERTEEGFYRFRGGIEAAIVRGLAYAPYADMLWCETKTPNLEEAKKFADAIHEKFPGKWLAYNCSPSFNWKKTLDDETIAIFQPELAKMGYKFQFVTLAGFHALNLSMFKLARGYAESGMPAYIDLQEEEFKEKENGYKAVEHQEFVGTKYFDEIAEIISEGQSSTTAMKGSTEEDQFKEK